MPKPTATAMATATATATATGTAINQQSLTVTTFFDVIAPNYPSMMKQVQVIGLLPLDRAQSSRTKTRSIPLQQHINLKLLQPVKHVHPLKLALYIEIESSMSMIWTKLSPTCITEGDQGSRHLKLAKIRGFRQRINIPLISQA